LEQNLQKTERWYCKIIQVISERRKYYDKFTDECLKGSSGVQIPDIKSNFIFEYDEDSDDE